MNLPTALRRGTLLAFCLCATEALADARLEARRHFRNGMNLIDQKQFDEGIAELEEAYNIKPHPSVLYNIARAYQDAGRLDEALDAYKRYLASNPPDAANVQAQVTRLEATRQAAQAEAPAPGAQPNTTGSGSSLPMPPPPPTSIQAQQQLAALMERLEKAVNRAESLAAQPAPAQATPTPGPTPTASGGAESGDISGDQGLVPYEERVVTASRRAQSSLEAPNATTVITAEDIRLSGATTLPELLRRVPGADVMAMGVGSANVSLRGFNQRLANKVLVLVDGRTEYQDFLGLTLWAGLPIGLEEIDRIEVIRGPGSALYGANAMLGVINIITQAPGTGRRARFGAMAGGGNTVQGSFVSHGQNGALRYRASAAYRQEDKWSRDYASGRSDFDITGPAPDLGQRGARANLSTIYSFEEGRAIGLSGGVHRYLTEIYPLGLLRNYYIDGLGAYAKADVELGAVKLKAFWNHLSGDAGPQYEAIGQRSLNTSVASNVFNAEALYARGFELAGEHQVNIGVEGRLKRVAFTYLDGLREEYHAAAFVQDEWRIVQPLRLVVSYRVDRHPLLDKGKPGLAQSPRLSAVFQPIEGHAFRASVATAFREPTFLESYTRLPVPVPGVNGVSLLTTGNRELRPERLNALELGWRGESPRLGLDWDVALYQNTVKDLIALSSVQPLHAGDAYDSGTGSYLLGRSLFTNENAIYTARGVEVGLNVSPIDGLGVKASAAYQSVTSDLPEEGQCGPCSQAPGFRLFGGVTYRTRTDLEFGIDAAFTSSTTWIEREPAATDPTRVELQANNLPAYTVVNARVGYQVVKDFVSVALQGSQLGGNHSEHPFGNRIERRVFANLTVTP
ncbi:TonB-dependent siderophore receptor [Corallococcus sp. Z5C101001]|uniref:TonB-dependent receptor plug domain-containing protein n=1 Tax=Corallococcus sp. Z5C101001 TaxID=2596829 RepID=UPI001180F622|nr:TonB-dependent receptor [Corallococcus sp. Z5C101001]TSC25079.1 TonB-dependent receptor [Corallococcus sp. Z5C101001]